MLPHRTGEGDLQEGGIENITGEPGSAAEELRLVQPWAPPQPSCCSGIVLRSDHGVDWLPPIHCSPLLNNLFVAVTITGDQWSCVFQQELHCTARSQDLGLHDAPLDTRNSRPRLFQGEVSFCSLSPTALPSGSSPAF